MRTSGRLVLCQDPIFELTESLDFGNQSKNQLNSDEPSYGLTRRVDSGNALVSYPHSNVSSLCSPVWVLSDLA
ncbi:hypothetical protein SAMN06265222_11843 [Neorhodopirellula lusitana]|uniref:Uncharacterized protein n=1 Tax=Neorhodopirellula lusitana TaxID=445327 RepID=A0ABY1QM85_9BACT|nr:hypothetical protein SAMN06265222_11843 [Neorhodopirellula lusitana]